MNIKKTIVTGGLLVSMLGAMITPAFATDGNYNQGNFGFNGNLGFSLPSLFSFTHNPLSFKQTSQDTKASFASSLNTQTSFAQQFQLETSNVVTSLMQDMLGIFGQGGFNPLGFLGGLGGGFFGFPSTYGSSSQSSFGTATQANQGNQFFSQGL